MTNSDYKTTPERIVNMFRDEALPDQVAHLEAENAKLKVIIDQRSDLLMELQAKNDKLRVEINQMVGSLENGDAKSINHILSKWQTFLSGEVTADEKDKWVWMPHAGHFICGSRCRFKLNTYVGGVIVSTVGEMPLHGEREDSMKWDTIGCDRLYETMVFKASRSKNKCCPWEQASGSDIDFEGYNTPEDAYAGHMKMCAKWAKKHSTKDKAE